MYSVPTSLGHRYTIRPRARANYIKLALIMLLCILLKRPVYGLGLYYGHTQYHYRVSHFSRKMALCVPLAINSLT